MTVAGAVLELAGRDELLVVIPVSVAIALVGILAYVVKKKDRQRERVHRAHQPPEQPPPPGASDVDEKSDRMSEKRKASK